MPVVFSFGRNHFILFINCFFNYVVLNMDTKSGFSLALYTHCKSSPQFRALLLTLTLKLNFSWKGKISQGNDIYFHKATLERHFLYKNRHISRSMNLDFWNFFLSNNNKYITSNFVYPDWFDFMACQPL